MNPPNKNTSYVHDAMEILLVEDEETDVKLILRALMQRRNVGTHHSASR